MKRGEGLLGALATDNDVALDAKAFRAENTLRVRAFWPEAGYSPGKQRLSRLDGELHRLAAFAGCDRVEYLPDWLRAG